MDNKTIEKLEFNKIKNIIKNYAKTYKGIDYINNLYPMNSKAEIIKALNQVSEASTLLYRKGNIPLFEIENNEEAIKKLKSDLFLSSKEILNLTKILNLSRLLKEYFQSQEIDMSNFVNLENYFNNLYINQNIEKNVSNSILDENTISDDASQELKTIRRNIHDKEDEIKNKLNSFIHSKYVQESIVTIRNNRYVVPVKNEYQSEVKGFIHDISASGSTIFIEPISIFNLNNDLNNLENAEIIEIEKILQKLSSLFFPIISSIENDINLIGLIDFIFSKAKYSNSINGIACKINDEKIIDLKNAWHPLIDQNKVVKNDIFIGKNYTSLIITGPNTGGKTVILKTCGLLVLMTLSGLHIPAKEGSSIYLFDNIFADIGDEQSIQDSLSTFSSHITKIAYILKNATTNSFILIDELGTGTDPVEGACLAISILEKLKQIGTITLSTTHFPELKHYALNNPGFENASVEFNIEKMIPTYKLLIGVPGTSNAFTISQKLGISEDIILRAKELIDSDKMSIEELLNNIYEDKRIIEAEKEQISKDYNEITTLKTKLDNDLKSLNENKTSILNKAKDEARDILLNAKDDVNDLIKEIEHSKNAKNANIAREKINKKIKDISQVNKEKESKEININDLNEGIEVYIKKINQTGTVISISKDKKIGVQLSLGKMYFKLNEIEIANNPKGNIKTQKDYSRKAQFKPKAISTEINVIGQNVDEACFTIDKYLDTSYMAGLSQIRIIHGKGTGALRKGIHNFLKNHPHVKSYRMGTFGEGEMGATIVELK